LLAQGVTPEAASHCAVFLHGAAADRLAQNFAGRGFLASEVMAAVPAEIQRLLDPIKDPDS